MPTTKVKISVQCDHLASKGDIFCVLYEKVKSEWKKLGRTEVIPNASSAKWKTQIDAHYHFEKRELLRFKVYAKGSDSNKFLGGMEVALGTLVAVGGRHYEALMTDGPSQRGRFVINTTECPTRKRSGQATFVDYIQNGTALNFSVAIDFTKSNGDPSSPDSLHYRGNPKGQNAYTKAIRALGPILTQYDDDNKYPAFGFGAKLPDTDEVSHDFFLNLRHSSPDCNGVDGILDAYAHALKKVHLSGPTFFAPVIRHAARIAKRHQSGRRYYVLLIITDGVIKDFEKTKSAIVDASDLPLSIIIVGVGKANFSSMVALDSDKSLIEYNGRKAKRDIVQFVEIRKFRKENGSWDKAGLAKEVLAEVPNQVVGWMQHHGIEPLNG